MSNSQKAILFYFQKLAGFQAVQWR